MSDINDILPSGASGKQPDRLSADKLSAYLEGRLSAAEQHEVEQWLADEGMESDALEGLKALEPEETRKAVAGLDLQLRRQLGTKRRGRRKPLSGNRWALIAIVVILILAVLAYVVIHMINTG